MDQADFAAGGSRDVFESFSCLSSLFAAVDFFLSAAAREICFFSTCTLSLFPISFEMDGGTRKRQSIRPSFGASQRSVAEILLRVVEITG